METKGRGLQSNLSSEMKYRNSKIFVTRVKRIYMPFSQHGRATPTYSHLPISLCPLLLKMQLEPPSTLKTSHGTQVHSQSGINASSRVPQVKHKM